MKAFQLGMVMHGWDHSTEKAEDSCVAEQPELHS